MLSIPSSAVNTLTAECLFGFLFPVIFLIIWRKKFKLNLFPLFLGVVSYAVFEQILVSLFNSATVSFAPEFASSLVPESLGYALYFGAATALFGEAGRYISFRFSINEKCHGILNSVTYGIGHGGAEFIVNLGFGSAFYALFAYSVNGGATAEALAGIFGGLSAVEETAAAVSVLGGNHFLLLAAERLCIFAMNILLSALMYSAAEKKSFLLPLCSFAIHAVVCIITTYYKALFSDVILLAAISAAVYFLIKRSLKTGEVSDKAINS